MRRCLVLALVTAACFSESNDPGNSGDDDPSEGTSASTTTSSSGDATSVATAESSVGSNDATSDSGMCDGGLVRVPDLPAGWEGWSFVVQGAPMQPALPCPGGGAPDVRFAEAMPVCRCACEPGFECTTTLDTFDDEACASPTANGAAIGEGCYAFPTATTVRVQGTGDSGASCEATGSLLLGPAAVPTSLCAAPDERCVEVPDGFVGPCVIGLGESCPDGLDELVEVDSVSCSVCPPCLQADVCAARRYDAFDDNACMGAPLATVPADGTCTGQDLQSVRLAPPDPMAPSGCADATLQLAHQRICCVP